MARIEGYNTRRSAFWRVIRLVVGELHIDNMENDGWPSRLVWSNLYKISPAAGGNPGTALQRAQFHGCAQLLFREIENYRPQRILFLTGYHWVEPFLRQVRCDCVMQDGQLVQAVGHITCGDHTTVCVVACHPQGQKEQNWVNAVMAAFNDLHE